MSFKTLLVELAVGESNQSVLNAARAIAGKMDAAVIGVAACQPIDLVYAEGFYAGSVVLQDQEELQKELDLAEAEFHKVLGPSVTSLAWHSIITPLPLADYICRLACEADLVITAGSTRTYPNSSRCAETGELIMQLGRPILVLPRVASAFAMNRVLVAWKESREARRAIADALPLLKQARSIVVAQFISPNDDLASARENLEGVGRWLLRHGLTAELLTTHGAGDDSIALGALIDQQRVDIVVAGAYGHSRLREWVLGGVTRDLLLHTNHCSFLSH